MIGYISQMKYFFFFWSFACIQIKFLILKIVITIVKAKLRLARGPYVVHAWSRGSAKITKVKFQLLGVHGVKKVKNHCTRHNWRPNETHTLPRNPCDLRFLRAHINNKLTKMFVGKKRCNMGKYPPSRRRALCEKFN